VHAVYNRIQRRSRHRDIVKYMDRRLPERAFGSWDMGLAKSVEAPLSITYSNETTAVVGK
jgi:hypothetical protein